MAELADVYQVPEAARRTLACGEGRETRWQASWHRDGRVVGHPVSDLGRILGQASQP